MTPCALHHPPVGHQSADAVRRRWAETAEWRHAYLGDQRYPGDQIVPMCDLDAVADVIVPIPGRPAPECPGCDVAWRRAEGIEQRAEHMSAARPGDGAPARPVPHRPAALPACGGAVRRAR